MRPPKLPAPGQTVSPPDSCTVLHRTHQTGPAPRLAVTLDELYAVQLAAEKLVLSNITAI